MILKCASNQNDFDEITGKELMFKNVTDNNRVREMMT